MPKHHPVERDPWLIVLVLPLGGPPSECFGVRAAEGSPHLRSVSQSLNRHVAVMSGGTSMGPWAP